MDRNAVAYRANGRVVIAPVVQTSASLGLEIEPQALGVAPDEGSVARALAKALSQSHRLVPQPALSELKTVFQPFLDATSVRSLRAFMKDAQRVSIRITDDQIRLTPQRNIGSQGFEPVSDGAVFIPAGDWEGAAATVLRLLGNP